MAQIQANIVLGRNRVIARQAIDKHRIEALRELKVTWTRVKVAEQMFYGVGSCFVETGRGHIRTVQSWLLLNTSLSVPPSPLTSL